MADSELRTAIDRATSARDDRAAEPRILAVYDSINARHDGPKIAAPMIIEKVQHHDSNVQYNALVLLDACVSNCGKSFHVFVGKYKVLNELIRLISRRYYPDAPDHLRKKVLELIQKWRNELDQPKIKEAYEKLKQEGHKFPRADPEDVLPGGTDSTLKRLLQSKDAADLEAANKLIKSMLHAEEVIEDEKYRLHSDLRTARHEVSHFAEMVDGWRPDDGPIDSIAEIKNQYKTMLAIKPRLLRLCTDFDDDRDVEDILEVSDRLQLYLERYTQLASQPPDDLDFPSRKQSTVAPQQQPQGLLLDVGSSTNGSSRQPTSMADDLLSLGLGTAQPSAPKQEKQMSDFEALASLNLGGTPLPAPTVSTPPALNIPTGAPNTGFSPLDSGSLSSTITATTPVSLDDILGPLSVGPNDMTLSTTSTPITVYQGNGVQVVIQSLQTSPHPDVQATLLCFLNQNTQPCSQFGFLAAVPKSMRVKLQPPSSDTLPAFSIVTGATPVTQVCLVANPSKAPVKMKFILSYTANGQQFKEQGTIPEFPTL